MMLKMGAEVKPPPHESAFFGFILPIDLRWGGGVAQR
jgi:hypothetical protein